MSYELSSREWLSFFLFSGCPAGVYYMDGWIYMTRARALSKEI